LTKNKHHKFDEDSLSLFDKGHQTETWRASVGVIRRITAEVDLLVEDEEWFVSIGDSRQVSYHLFLDASLVIRVIRLRFSAVSHIPIIRHTVDIHVHDGFVAHGYSA